MQLEILNVGYKTLIENKGNEIYLSQSNSEDVEFNIPIPEDIAKVESLIHKEKNQKKRSYSMNNSKFPTVLVTGAAGGIGWTVTKMLLEKGCQVVAFDDYTTGLTRNEAPGLTWQDADIADPAIADKLNQYPIDAIVHLAARLADQSMKAPAADVRTNAFWRHANLRVGRHS